MANLPTDHHNISQALAKKGKKLTSGTAANTQRNESMPSMLGSNPASEAEPGTLKASLEATPAIDKITDQMPASAAHREGDEALVAGDEDEDTEEDSKDHYTFDGYYPQQMLNASDSVFRSGTSPSTAAKHLPGSSAVSNSSSTTNTGGGYQPSTNSPSSRTPGGSVSSVATATNLPSPASASSGGGWVPTSEWVLGWKQKLPLQTIMRLLQVLVPQVEKICIDKGLTDESEILKFLQHGTLVGLLPVPHPILIRKYQSNTGTSMWFRTYMWGVIYLRNVDPPIWYDTDVRLFEIQRV